MEDLIGAILSCLFEIFGEFLFQVVLQFLLEMFLRFVSELFQPSQEMGADADVAPAPNPATDPRAHPAAIWVLYATLGAVFGVLSLALRPQHFIRLMSHRWLNLLITPLLAGGAMAALGSWRDKRGQRLVGMDKFFNGWGFALAFAAVRMVWCR